MVKLTKKDGFQQFCDIFDKMLAIDLEKDRAMIEILSTAKARQVQKDTIKVKRPTEYIAQW